MGLRYVGEIWIWVDNWPLAVSNWAPGKVQEFNNICKMIFIIKALGQETKSRNYSSAKFLYLQLLY